MEHDVILKVLQANHWNRRRTAEVLKISYRALLYKVRQAGLPAKRPRRKQVGDGAFSAESSAQAGLVLPTGLPITLLAIVLSSDARPCLV